MPDPFTPEQKHVLRTVTLAILPIMEAELVRVDERKPPRSFSEYGLELMSELLPKLDLPDLLVLASLTNKPLDEYWKHAELFLEPDELLRLKAIDAHARLGKQ